MEKKGEKREPPPLKKNLDLFFFFSKCWRVFTGSIQPPVDREADVDRKQLIGVQPNHAGPLKKRKRKKTTTEEGCADAEIWTARFHYSESVKYTMKPFTGCKTEMSLVTNKASTSQRRKQRPWRIFTSSFSLFTLLTTDC